MTNLICRLLGHRLHIIGSDSFCVRCWVEVDPMGEWPTRFKEEPPEAEARKAADLARLNTLMQAGVEADRKKWVDTLTEGQDLCALTPSKVGPKVIVTEELAFYAKTGNRHCACGCGGLTRYTWLRGHNLNRGK